MGFSTFPNNPFPPSTAQFEEGKNDAIQAEIDAMKDGTNIDSFGDVESALALKANTADMTTALATKTNLSNIAPTFDATSGVYAVGDKVIHDGVLYEFTSAHSTAGDWDESEVQPVKVSELINSLESGLTNLTYWKNEGTSQSSITVTEGYEQLKLYATNESGGTVWAEMTILGEFLPSAIVLGTMTITRSGSTFTVASNADNLYLKILSLHA